MDVKTVLETIKLSGEKEKSFLTRLGQTEIPVHFIRQPELKVTEATVEGEVAEIKDHDGKRLATALSWTCQPNVINLLYAGGPLIARRFSFSVGPISWSAGGGFPVYTTYCPVNAYGSRDYYPHAKSHQVVPAIQGQNYFVGCNSSGVCESAGAGQITFAVNDWIYGDNRGYFTVVIYSWS